MKIRIVFDTGYELTVSLYDNDFVKRWCRLLDQEIRHGSLLQEDTFSGFIPESLAKERLRQSIVTVNNFLKREYIAIPSDKDYKQSEFYNLLHEKFEQLAGPDWDHPSRLMCIAPAEIKLAVRHINRYCHRLETRPYKVETQMRVEFDTTQRCLLEPDDYALFQPNRNPNVVLLDYSTLGKSLRECFQDGLTADYHHVKIQQHYCANFILRFEPEPYTTQGFIQWCHQQGINNIPSSELGHIQLGTIDQPDSYECVKKTATIQSITLE